MGCAAAPRRGRLYCLRSTVSGMGTMWVELHESGRIDCSRAVGRAREWSATKRDGRWELLFVLEDKLSRAMRFVSEVRTDEIRGLVLGAGQVYGPPKAGASASEVAALRHSAYATFAVVCESWPTPTVAAAAIAMRLPSELFAALPTEHAGAPVELEASLERQLSGAAAWRS